MYSTHADARTWLGGPVSTSCSRCGNHACLKSLQLMVPPHNSISTPGVLPCSPLPALWQPRIASIVQAIVIVNTVGTGIATCAFCCFGIMCGSKAGSEEVRVRLANVPTGCASMRSRSLFGVRHECPRTSTPPPCCTCVLCGGCSQLAAYDEHVLVAGSKWTKRWVLAVQNALWDEASCGGAACSMPLSRNHRVH